MARDSSQVATRLTATPTRAVTSTRPPATTGGLTSRRTASQVSQPARTSRVVPLACAERISARLSPKVYPPRAGRAASRIATSASRIAPASVSMCAASDSSASECATRPASTSAAMNPTMSASAPASQRRSASALTPWWCPAGACGCAWLTLKVNRTAAGPTTGIRTTGHPDHPARRSWTGPPPARGTGVQDLGVTTG